VTQEIDAQNSPAREVRSLNSQHRTLPLLAQAAAEHSSGKSDALHGFSLLHVGQAYAMLGEHKVAHLRQQRMEAATAVLHEAIDLVENTHGSGGLTVVFGAARELYPWRNEQAVHDVHGCGTDCAARARAVTPTTEFRTSSGRLPPPSG